MNEDVEQIETHLEHEVRNNSVEDRVLVSISVLTGTHLTKVSSSQGDHMIEELSNKDVKAC